MKANAAQTPADPAKSANGKGGSKATKAKKAKVAVKAKTKKAKAGGRPRPQTRRMCPQTRGSPHMTYIHLCLVILPVVQIVSALLMSVVTSGLIFHMRLVDQIDFPSNPLLS